MMMEIETEFEQSDEEDERVYGRFVVNEDEEDYEKEPSEADTDEYDTDDLRSVHDYEDEENIAMRGKTRGITPKFKQYYRDHDLRFPKFSLGLEFPTRTKSREVVQYYANSCVRLLKFVKNEPGRLRIKCNGKS
ncbi:unnamed protein product [Prunus armeniaca]